MSSADWLHNMARLNYFAGKLSSTGTHHVAVAQARELADHYERLAQDHEALQAMSPSTDLGAFMDLTLQSPSPPRVYNFAVYTPTSPCPDEVSPSGGRKRTRPKGIVVKNATPRPPLA